MGCGQSTDTSRENIYVQPSPQPDPASVDTAASKQAEEAVSAVRKPAEKTATAEAAPTKQAEEENSTIFLGEKGGCNSSVQPDPASVETAAAKQAVEAVSAVRKPAEKKAAAEAAPAKQAEEENSRILLGEEDGENSSVRKPAEKKAAAEAAPAKQAEEENSRILLGEEDGENSSVRKTATVVSRAALRRPFILKHTCLFDKQILVAKAMQMCHYNGGDVRGWPDGWMTAFAGMQVVFDLGSEAVVTKVSMQHTNILASPKGIVSLWSSTNAEGPWEKAYELQKAQCNRLQITAPTNHPNSECGGCAEESFYLLGSVFNDPNPQWDEFLRIKGHSVDEHSYSMLANRGTVLSSPGWGTAARFWQLRMDETNGLHYIGTNYAALYGNILPLPPPSAVSTKIVAENGEDAIEVTWGAVEAAAEYVVVAHAKEVGKGSGGFERHVQDTLCRFGEIHKTVPYVFVVFAVDSKGQLGQPSQMTKTTCIEEVGWALVHEVDFNFEDCCAEKKEETVNPPTGSLSPTGHSVAQRNGSEGGAPGRLGRQTESSVTALTSSEIKILLDKAEALRRGWPQTSAEYRMKQEKSVRELIKGNFTMASSINSSTQVVVFMSSTFDDTTAERNYFMAHAYPYLSAFCKTRGLSFGTVDLRWGVRSESTDEHGTIDICLGELERCMRTSTAASFVFLSGERYGWRALPPLVSAIELESILAKMQESDGKTAMTQWYLRDDNCANGGQYVLQTISSMKGKPGVKLDNFWGGAQDAMQLAVRRTIQSHPDLEEIGIKWMVSVTEKEVQAGLLENNEQDIEFSTLVLMRTIEGLAEAASTAAGSGSISDEVDPWALKYYTPIDDDRALLDTLRKRVCERTPKKSLREFNVPWRPGGLSLDLHAEYLHEITSAFLADMTDRISVSLEKRPVLSTIQRECVEQHTFALMRAEGFSGREDVAAAVYALLSHKLPSPVRCVYGRSGSGKTSVCCLTAVSAGNTGQWSCVVFRACGTSAGSSDALSLLASISAQLQLAAGEVAGGPKREFDEQVAEFHRCLKLFGQSSPPLVIIDSIDQMSNTFQERTQPWRWLPAPDADIGGAVILVSTLLEREHGVLPALRPVLQENCLCEVNAVASTVAIGILEASLQRSGRRLQAEQLSLVLNSLKNAEDVTMLHVRLLHDRTVKWHSFDTVTAPPASVTGLIHSIFEDIERRSGVGLVTKVMGLMNAARAGLSEANLLDLVSCDDVVLGHKGQDGAVLQWHDPPIRRLPPIVFSRLRQSLRDMVVERGSHGAPVLGLFHRQFIEVSSQRYPKEEHHMTLAAFFSGELSVQFPERNIDAMPLFFHSEISSEDGSGSDVGSSPSSRFSMPNRQKLHELPYALRMSGQEVELTKLLTDLKYISAIFFAGSAFTADLIRDYKYTLVMLSDAADLRSFMLFACRWYHVLCLEPAMLVTLAASAPISSPVSRAVRLLAPGHQPQLLWRHRPRDQDPMVLKKMCGGEVVACAWCPDGSKFVVCFNKMCSVFDADTSSFLSACASKGDVLCCAFSPNGKEVLCGTKFHGARVWDVATGTVSAVLKHHDSEWVLACAHAASILVTGSTWNLLRVWEASSGSILHELEGHSGAVTTCSVSPSVSLLASGSADGSVVVWDLLSGAPSAVLRGARNSGRVNAVAWSPDERMIAAACDGACCNVWSCSNWSPKMSLKGHLSEVFGCCFSPDSKEVVTTGADRVARIFDVQSGMELFELEGHTKWVTACAWVRYTILSVSLDGSAIVWERSLLRQQEARAHQQFIGMRLVEDGMAIRTLSSSLVSVRYEAQDLQITEEVPPAEGGEGDSMVGVVRSANLLDDNMWGGCTYSSSYYLQEALSPGQGTTLTIPYDVASTTLVCGEGGKARLCGGHGHPNNVGLFRDGEMVHRFQHKSWLVDMHWANTKAVIACQKETLICNMSTNEVLLHREEGLYCARLDSSERRVAGIGIQGGGYQINPTHGMVLDAADGREITRFHDPHGELSNFQIGHGMRWLLGDTHVAFLIPSSSVFGCPLVSIYSASSGAILCRFASPFSADFSHLDACDHEGGAASTVAVTDQEGRVFVLDIKSRLTS